MFLYFSQRGPWQPVDRNERSRYFERGEYGPAPCFEGSRIESSIADHVRHGNFTPYFVRQRRDGRFAYLFLLQKKLLDLARVDIKSPGDDQVAAAALQRVIAVLRFFPYIAG